MELDEIDLKILKMIQNNAKMRLEKIAEYLHVPKSTVAYRLKRLEKMGIIRGYHVYIDPLMLDLNYIVITFVKAKYGKDYHEIIGKKLSELPGVWGVYFILGDIDFVVMARFRDRKDFVSNYLEKLISMPEIERTSTQVVVKIIRETPYLIL